MAGVVLRDYQTEVMESVTAAMRRGVKRNLLVLSTGGGKTAIAAYMIDRASRRGKKCWFVVHRKELLDQTSDVFQSYGVHHGLIASGRRVEPFHDVQIVLIGSLASREAQIPAPDLIIADEAHHMRAASWAKMVERQSRAWLIGLTATPQRLDGRGLGEHFDSMHVGKSMAWLIRQGRLANYRMFCPPAPDLTGVTTTAGDFNAADLRKKLSQSTITGDAITEYRRHANGKQAIVRSIDVAASIEAAARFRAAGYNTAHVDGTTPRAERDRIFRDFRDHRITVLSQVELAGEGVDIPGIEVAIDLRPTKSLTLWMQYIGRALRPAPGKEAAILLDHVGNAARLGLPDDAREWSLEDTKKKPKSPSLWTCRACFGAFDHPHAVCPSCGAVMDDHRMGRSAPKTVVGTLREIDPEKMRAQREAEMAARAARMRQGSAKTIEGLKEIARQRGYSEGWARHVFEARRNRRA